MRLLKSADQMSKMAKIDLLDDFEPIDRGFAAALRNKEYYLFLVDVFSAMNKIQHDLLRDGPLTDSYFLDKAFKATVIGRNWLKIKALYERGKAPIRATSLSIQRVEPIDGPGGELVERTTEALEYEELMSALHVLYPPPTGPGDDIKSFAKFFRSRKASDADKDFSSLRELLEVTCLHMAGLYSPQDMELHEKNPREAIEKREERMRRVRSIFSRGASNIVSGASQVMVDLLLREDRIRRCPTYSGVPWNSFDGVLQGLPGIGLTTIIGGTGGGKSLAKSSLVANYCLKTFDAGKEAPSSWGFIGEDGIEMYARRVMTNIMNRLRGELGIEEFKMADLQTHIAKDPAFRTIFIELLHQVFANTYWIKAPQKPEEKLNFSVINILNTFDAKLDAGAEKPAFIIIDYFNLLNLPRAMSNGNTAKDLSIIAHMLDEWAEQRDIPVITSVQASIGGVLQAREGLRFFELEDQHESKSIAHSSRMVLSILPHTTEYDQKGGDIKRMMGIKVLKNRGGPKGQIFLSNLDESKNIVLADSTLISPAEWARHKLALMEKQQALGGLELVSHGAGKGGNYGRQQGGERRASGDTRKPKGGFTPQGGGSSGGGTSGGGGAGPTDNGAL